MDLRERALTVGPPALGYGVLAVAATLAPVAAVATRFPRVGLGAFFVLAGGGAVGTMLVTLSGVGRAGERPPLPIEERVFADPPDDHGRRMRRLFYLGGLSVGGLAGTLATGLLWL